MVVGCAADSGRTGSKPPPSQPSANAKSEPVPEDGLPVPGVYEQQVEEVSNDCPSRDGLNLDISKTASIFALDRPDKKFPHLRWISVPFWGTGVIDLTLPEPQIGGIDTKSNKIRLRLTHVAYSPTSLTYHLIQQSTCQSEFKVTYHLKQECRLPCIVEFDRAMMRVCRCSSTTERGE